MRQPASALNPILTRQHLALWITSLPPALFGKFLCLIFSDQGDLVFMKLGVQVHGRSLSTSLALVAAPILLLTLYAIPIQPTAPAAAIASTLFSSRCICKASGCLPAEYYPVHYPLAISRPKHISMAFVSRCRQVSLLALHEAQRSSPWARPVRTMCSGPCASSSHA